MANQKNQVIPIPLNGDINFAKNKTKISQFTGFNDLNSPIYGGMISPLYMKERPKLSPGNGRPYLDEDKILRDNEGHLILDISKYKGLKRTELTSIPEDALAVYDENTYVDIKRDLDAGGDTYFTAIHYLDKTTEAPGVLALSNIKANAAAFATEANLLIIHEAGPTGGKIHFYDLKEILDNGTIVEKASKRSLSTASCSLNTFYDPLTKWQITSIYEPFGDWDYRKQSSYSVVSEEWKEWKKKLDQLQYELEALERESEPSKNAYDKILTEKNKYNAKLLALQKEREKYQADYDEYDYNCKVNAGIASAIFPFAWISYAASNKARAEAKDNINAVDNKIKKVREELEQWLAADNKEWNMSNDEALKTAYYKYNQKLSLIAVKRNEIISLKELMPEHYLDLSGKTNVNPNIYAGRTDKAYNFIYDTNTGNLVEKSITIPWDKLGAGSQGPHEDSYIITGIYDSHFETSSTGKWISNTNKDYVRYRLGVVPYDISLGMNEEEKTKYFFSLNYTPKIHFREQNALTKDWAISEDIPNETITYIENKYTPYTPKGGSTADSDPIFAQDADVYFSGSGNGSRAIIWGKVNFVVEDTPEITSARLRLTNAQNDTQTAQYEKNVAEEAFKAADQAFKEDQSPENKEKLDKATQDLQDKNNVLTEKIKAEDAAEKDLNALLAKIPDFNKRNLFHDLGYAKYTMYSPCSQPADKHRGNATSNTVSGARDISKENFNYELSGDGLLWETPMNDGEQLKRKVEANVFREIISNGIITNIAIAETPQHIGTFIETANSIDSNIPIFYKNGKTGNEVIFKSTQRKWISIKVTDSVEEIKIINNDYLIIYTTKITNCIKLKNNSIHHFAPDWNHRFSLVGSPYYENDITPIVFPAINSIESNVDISHMLIASGIKVNYEITQDPIVGYTSAISSIYSNENNITPVAFISDYDNIEFYFADKIRSPLESVPTYYSSMSATSLRYGLFNDIDLINSTYPSLIVNTVGLFCNIKPSNFGRYYLDDGNTFYSLKMYNGQIFFAYDTSSLLDDIKEIFMVQGQTFAITKSDYLYSVFVNQNGTTSLADAIANIKGLQFCGAIPEMAIFYSPIDRTLKSFTADHMLKNIEEANIVSEVYYTTYCPQTSAVYICTNAGVYVYSASNKYKLPVIGVKEIYFGGPDYKHVYIDTNATTKESPLEPIETVKDYVYDRGYSASQSIADSDLKDYEIQPTLLETKFYGHGNNIVSITDCVYFRLYSDDAPFNTTLKIKEKSLVDGSYNTLEKEIKVSKTDWDQDTKTCYVRYQPKYQRNVGISIQLVTECAITEISFSNSIPETVAISKPRLNG